METSNVNAKKSKRLGNQQPSPLVQAIANGEGSTTIPKGSRVQVNSKREAIFNLTLCFITDKLYQYKNIRSLSCGQKTMYSVRFVDRVIVHTWQKDFAPDAMGNIDDIVCSAWKTCRGQSGTGCSQHKRDEIEKGLAGMAGSGDLDSGVTARVVSTILTWRQETKYPVMLVATANNVTSLPSMVYRKGRLDEVWATDLPHTDERAEIFRIHLRKRERDPEKFGCYELAERTENFTGSEIEACIEDAMFTAFDAGIEVTAAHILRSIRDTIPQSVRDDVEIRAIREWVANKARLVSAAETKTQKSNVRRISTKRKGD